MAITSVLAVAIASMLAVPRAAERRAFRDPAVDAPLTKVRAQESAVFAGGCFWGIEAVFQHVKGVKTAVSGYSGGTANTAKYDLIGRGNTGHAESVEVTYDRAQITYGQLLKIFFAVAHDPTQLNRQGPDVGPQYRSAIFYSGDEQKRIAEGYVAQLQEAHVYLRRIVTQIVPLQAFYPAEDYHQDYAAKNPFDIYIMTHDAPKIAHFKTAFPKLYVRK
ncbi:MAG: peptide-methionine (S)-S-oxide reductase MsrA [Acidobacteria bacterium]|nr:peptide-methionine (S)-S-oxide reductase MsrA [Acidobacteriota bacterium]